MFVCSLMPVKTTSLIERAVFMTPLDMGGPIIGPVEDTEAFLAGEGPGRLMQSSGVAVKVSFASKWLRIGAARPSAPKIAWLRAAVASGSG